MNTTNQASDARYVWAFAVDTVNRQRRTRRHQTSPQRSLHRYTITACSRRAKELGVQQGMAYSEARQIAPDIRVIVCNR